MILSNITVPHTSIRQLTNAVNPAVCSHPASSLLRSGVNLIQLRLRSSHHTDRSSTPQQSPQFTASQQSQSTIGADIHTHIHTEGQFRVNYYYYYCLLAGSQTTLFGVLALRIPPWFWLQLWIFVQGLFVLLGTSRKFKR